LLAQGDDIIPLPGSKSIKYAEENVRAVEINLSRDDVDRITEAVESAEKNLAKYSAHTTSAQMLSFLDTPPLEGWSAQ
jgi:diketogulonate reductase-like aldo/keto reductase